MKKMFAVCLAAALILAPLPARAQSNECGTGPSVPFAHETITVSTTAVGFTLATYAPSSPPKANQAFVSVNSNSVRVWFDGTSPTASDGILIAAGQTFRVCAASLARTLMIRAVGVDAEVAVQYSGPPA
jgi:hypothetical protein